MKLLVTGAAGFVGRHFLTHLKFANDCKIIATYNWAKPDFEPQANTTFHQLNLLQLEAVQSFLLMHQPTHILHLAAQSSVGKSWTVPYTTIQHNVIMTHNFLEAIRVLNLNCKIVVAGSAEIYAPSNEPLQESNALHTHNPYALSKYTTEQLCELYNSNYRLNIICTRSFNQIGPFQNINFVIPSFVKQIITQLQLGATAINLSVGNINVVRDFTDVRDTVHAYNALLFNTNNHNIYNVCSGVGLSIKNIIDAMSQYIKMPINIIMDETKLRPSDNPIIVGEGSLLKQEFNWQPKINLQQTITDIFEAQITI
jgi:GDP-4-dehydro-6-deoxy-D-mannose reductase